MTDRLKRGLSTTDDFGGHWDRNQFHRSAFVKCVPIDPLEFRPGAKCHPFDAAARREAALAQNFDRCWNANRSQRGTGIEGKLADRSKMRI
jgi:hypothetical protein